MDPGMAFGTGQHASTRMCLEALEDVLLHDNTGNMRHVLDVGSGTGILGIAAAKLGAQKVLCVDIDKQATDISKENIVINQVGGPGRGHNARRCRHARIVRLDCGQPYCKSLDQISFTHRFAS